MVEKNYVSVCLLSGKMWLALMIYNELEPNRNQWCFVKMSPNDHCKNNLYGCFQICSWLGFGASVAYEVVHLLKGRWFTPSPSLHVEVSMGKKLNPKLLPVLFHNSVKMCVCVCAYVLLMSRLAPCVKAPAITVRIVHEYVNVACILKSSERSKYQENIQINPFTVFNSVWLV